VSDIFNEVDEEVRREQLRRLWERYSILIVALIVLIVAGVGGWRAYEWYQDKQAAQTGEAFQNAVALAGEGKQAEARAAFDTIAKTGTRSYETFARLQSAALLEQTDKKAALAAYDAIEAGGGVNQVLKDVSVVRAGMLAVDLEGYDAVRKRLEPQASDTAPFRQTARELLAMAALKAGDKKAARTWIEKISTDPQANGNVRGRVQMMQALLGAEGNS